MYLRLREISCTLPVRRVFPHALALQFYTPEWEQREYGRERITESHNRASGRAAVIRVDTSPG